MRTVSNSTNGSTGIWVWKSPIPYLFGGLAAMLGLIALALIILVCSNCKASANSSNGGTHEEEEEGGEKPAKTMNKLPPVDKEPKVVVIMPGDNQPTFLAKPISTTHHEEQV